jgi:hypothetical protein
MRLVDDATGKPRPYLPVQIKIVTQWVPSSKPGYNVSDGFSEVSTDTVSDEDGYFSLGKTRVVPEGWAPAGNDPAYVPHFDHVAVCFDHGDGVGCAYIERETIEAVRSGKQAYVELRSGHKGPDDAQTKPELDVVVDPRADWTNSGLWVRRGDVVLVTATGTISLGSRGVCDANGISAADADKLMSDTPTGALIAVIGDRNDDFIQLGTKAEFTAPHEGYLFFGVNEGQLRDNSGTLSVHVRILR